MTRAARNSSAEPDLRPPELVMRLARMGAFHATRLSFMRVLIRRLHAERVRVRKRLWEIDGYGFGRAVYSFVIGGRNYSLCAFTAPLEPEARTDRVIATAWDATFALFDGIPDGPDLERIRANVECQEAGRYRPTELVISRANKSVRLFEHTVDRLAGGKQPDAGLLMRTGYLMRTTAVYGNGKFGIADRCRISGRSAFIAPFQAELLAVWLIRGFTHDLAEHVASSRNPGTSARLDPASKRHLGIGNATGLGMAPFLVSHPILLNNWMLARETAFARARGLERLTEAQVGRAMELFSRTRRHLSEWNVEDARQMARIETLRSEFESASVLFSEEFLSGPLPWGRITSAVSGMSLEAQEFVVSLAIEPHGDLVDDLADGMSSTALPEIDPGMPVRELRGLVRRNYGWAIDVDYGNPESRRHFWYVSKEKMEPRLGDRHREPGAQLELPLDVALKVKEMSCDLGAGGGDRSAAEFLARHPAHRYAVRRVQTSAKAPYSEIRENLIGADCLPVDMLRCKLSFFGASKFDPKSDLWTRITMFQGAPSFQTVAHSDADDWCFPVQGA